MNTKQKLSMSVGAAALLATLSPAQAGAYVSIFGGWNILGNDVGSRAGSGLASVVTSKSHSTTGAGTHTDIVTFTFATNFLNSGAKARDGFLLGASVGGDLSHWMSGLRGEFEVALRRNDLGRAQHNATPTTTVDTKTIVHVTGTYPVTTTLQATAAVSSSGSARTFSLMANVWYDFDMGSSFKPYVGGGVGYAMNEVKHGLVLNGNEGAFAWQLGGGINYSIGDKTSVGLGYRYMDAGSVALELAPSLSGRQTDTYDVQHHSVLVNVNFSLGK